MTRLPRFFLAALLFLFAALKVTALSDLTQITPKTPHNDDLRFNFDIKADRLKDGNILFRISITGHIRGGKIQAIYDAKQTSVGTDLTDVHEVTAFPSPGATYETVQEEMVRSLPADITEKAITCIFIVPEKSLSDPHLSFCLTLAEKEHSAADTYYANLKDFYAP
jgi:hypothetical protein